MKHSSSPVVTFVEKQESQVLELTASPFLDIDLVKNIHNDQNKGDDGTVTTTSDKSTPLFEQLATVLEVENQSLDQLPRHKPLVCGHRGCGHKSLENTRHSIQMAHKIGCKEVEVDIFLLKCGTLVCFHGYGTFEDPGGFENYCTNMDGRVTDYAYHELKDYKFNPNYEEFSCGPDVIRAMEKEGACYIPTLEEVLMDIKRYNMIIHIELKGPDTSIPALELVEKLDMVDQVHFCSFELDKIQIIRELRPQRHPTTGQYVYKTEALFEFVFPDNFVQLSLDVGANDVNLCYSTCSKSRVDAIHAAGLGSACWFRGPIGIIVDTTTRFDDVESEDEKMFRIVMATGVMKMCTNKPDILMQLLLDK